MKTAEKIAPVSKKNRILILDSLRGIALCGILLMNIAYFGMPESAIENPNLLNETNTFNGLIQKIIFVFFNGTQRALFSMLFGAGILLFLERAVQKSNGLIPADLYFRRNLFLILFGLINAYLFLWYGDILFVYGICGLLLFVFRNLSVKQLLMAAGICIALVTVRENVDLYRMKSVIKEGKAALKIEDKKRSLDQTIAAEKYEALKSAENLETKKEADKRSVHAHRGTYTESYSYISEVSFKAEVSWSMVYIGDILVFMFIGMAFYKSGLIMGNGSTRTYLIMTIIGLSLGFIAQLNTYRVFDSLNFDWIQVNIKKDLMYWEFIRTLRSLGTFGLLMLLFKSGWFNWLFKAFQPMGQMAFTNYLIHSIICGFIFLGAGLGYFGQLERWELYVVAFAIMLFQMIYSPIWLQFFHFGPFEWLWRTLSYGNRQPFKK